MGRLADLKGPPAVIERTVGTFCRVYNVNMEEVQVPAEGYRSFDDFFTRELIPGARPIAEDPELLVCPSDGRLEDCGPIEHKASFRVKGRLYDVAELIDDPSATGQFAGGSFAVIYLAPPDYHRVHAPVDGAVTEVRHVAGTLYPVNSIGLEHVPRLFAKNERVVVEQDSPRYGRVCSILVGAIGVGRIGLSFDPLLTNTNDRSGGGVRRVDGPELARGDEVGMFHMGSTVILLTTAKSPLSFVKAPGDRTRMGEALARRGVA
ncbi:MAG: archaetidylserine decarboxylase [Myxococcota bacterium]